MAAEPPFAHWRERVEATLSRAIDAGAYEPRLRAAMRHAAQAAASSAASSAPQASPAA